MSTSNAAALAVRSTSPREVLMPKALTVTRAPADAQAQSIVIKRDRQADLKFGDAKLILTVETEPVPVQFGSEEQRWRVYRLFENSWRSRAVVAQEGHSNVQGETVRYGATVCSNGVEVWEAMGGMDELKDVLAEIGWPAVEEI